MNDLQTLESFGLTLPGPGYLFGAIVFGLVGWAAWRHGKRAGLPVPKWLGVVLMLFPYAVSDTRLLYLVGGALCLGVYLWRH